MKVVVSALFFFIFAPALSQSVTALDDRNGIKDFELGTHFSNYKSRLELIGNNGKSSYYKDISESSKTLFDLPIDNITLQFYSERLYKTILTFFWGETNNSKLIADLVDLFGPETENNTQVLPGGQEQNSFTWEGIEVRLTLVYDETTTRLTLYSKSIHREILQDEF
jgi:hypothetical protein